MIRQALKRITGRPSSPPAGRWRLIGTRADAIAPGKIVWMFGTARTGSTWISSVMGEMDGYSRWHEPLVGHLFGNLYYVRAGHRTRDEHFVLGGDKRLWLDAVRNFVLETATARFPEVAREEGGYLIVKEPHGSIGAPLLMEALPESRMILLVRDPRDVVASNLDAHRKGSWTYDVVKKGGKEKQETLADSDPDNFVKSQAARYVRDIGNAREALEAHEGRKIVLKYEDLRADTLGSLKRMYTTLDLPFDMGQLERVVEKHAWENIPEDQKGKGKFYRKGKAQGWREDLTPAQVEIVEQFTGSLIEEFYPA